MVMHRADGRVIGSDTTMLKVVPPENNNQDQYEAEHRLPAYARVQVPLGNKSSNRKVAEILERLAYRMRQIQADPDLSINRARLLTWFEIKTANSDLQDATKSGDPAKI